jgi:quercetin dioxygenase-like cupin family protein
MDGRMTLQMGMQQLSKSGKDHTLVFNHGSLDVEYYKPEKIDHQTPHIRDEVYVIASGSGFFVKGGDRQPFEAGEVIFVPAYVEHVFEDFTEDFATWVFFFGPEGGEVA